MGTYGLVFCTACVSSSGLRSSSFHDLGISYTNPKVELGHFSAAVPYGIFPLNFLAHGRIRIDQPHFSLTRSGLADEKVNSLYPDSSPTRPFPAPPACSVHARAHLSTRALYHLTISKHSPGTSALRVSLQSGP